MVCFRRIPKYENRIGIKNVLISNFPDYFVYVKIFDELDGNVLINTKEYVFKQVNRTNLRFFQYSDEYLVRCLNKHRNCNALLKSVEKVESFGVNLKINTMEYFITFLSSAVIAMLY